MHGAAQDSSKSSRDARAKRWCLATCLVAFTSRSGSRYNRSRRRQRHRQLVRASARRGPAQLCRCPLQARLRRAAMTVGVCIARLHRSPTPSRMPQLHRPLPPAAPLRGTPWQRYCCSPLAVVRIGSSLSLPQASLPRKPSIATRFRGRRRQKQLAAARTMGGRRRPTLLRPRPWSILG